MTTRGEAARRARTDLTEREIARVDAWLKPAELEAALTFGRTHDFEEAWRHSAGGAAIEAELGALLGEVLGFHHLAPCRSEKISGHHDHGHAHHLLSWHRNEPPQRTNLRKLTDRRVLIAAVLFHDVGARDSTLEVIPGSDREDRPRFRTAPVRLTGPRGTVWLFSAYAWRRFVPRDISQLVPSMLWTPTTRRLDDRIRRALLTRARRWSVGAQATALLRPPTALDVALTVAVEGPR